MRKAARATDDSRASAGDSSSCVFECADLRVAPSSFVAQFSPSTSQQRPEERGERKFLTSTVSLICFEDNEWSRIPSHLHKSLDMLRIFPDIVAAITQVFFLE